MTNQSIIADIFEEVAKVAHETVSAGAAIAAPEQPRLEP